MQVDHCRHDDDGPGQQPTPPERDYCQVYYPDRPKSGGFIVQKVELRSDIVKKLQTCEHRTPRSLRMLSPARCQLNLGLRQERSAPSRPSTDTTSQQTLQFNAPYHCNGGMTVTVTSCEQQAGREYCEIKVEQNGKFVFKDVDLREQVFGWREVMHDTSFNPPSIRAADKIGGDYREWQVF